MTFQFALDLVSIGVGIDGKTSSVIVVPRIIGIAEIITPIATHEEKITVLHQIHSRDTNHKSSKKRGEINAQVEIVITTSDSSSDIRQPKPMISL